LHSRAFGVKVAHILFTPDEINTKSNNSLIEEIVTTGRLNTGKAPERVLNG
jgi:hypothetical protein